MWRCPKCGENMEDTLGVCRRCGTSPAGTSDPGGDPDRLATMDAVPGPVSGRRFMTRLEIAELACRIMAIWVFAQCALAIVPVIVLPVVAYFTRHWPSSIFQSCMALLFPLGELVFGIFLWKKAGAIARRMVSPDPTPVAATNLDSTSLMTVAFTAIGIYCVWWSLGQLFRIAGSAFYLAQNQILGRADAWSGYRKADLFGSLCSLTFSLWLLLGSRGIVRFVQRLRGGTASSEENPAEEEKTRS